MFRRIATSLPQILGACASRAAGSRVALCSITSESVPTACRLFSTQVQLINSGKLVAVSLFGTTVSKFHAKWLWYNCSRHKERDSGQRTLEPWAMRHSPEIVAAVQDAHALHISWSDGTKSSFELQWLRENDYSYPALQEAHSLAKAVALVPRQESAKSINKADVPTFDFSDILGRDDAVHAWLQSINQYGIAIVKNAPVDDRTVLRVASRISHPMWTIYGEVWDVAVMPNPINIAYAPVGLDLHVDLVYYESPPGLQLLHCKRFDAEVVGGESTFLDGIMLAEEFRKRHPQHFETFLRVPATFQKIHYQRASPVHIQMQRPHISVHAASGDITGMFWAPPFEGPLRVPAHDVDPYMSAYEEFSSLVQEYQNSSQLIEYRMEPGDISIFNNRRMLHGRRHFHAGAGMNAQRILQGCYVNIDEYKSRLLTLCSKFGGKNEVKRVSNQNWY
jgi:hypothetical protein